METAVLYVQILFLWNIKHTFAKLLFVSWLIYDLTEDYFQT